jgi:hypothetical protein
MIWNSILNAIMPSLPAIARLGLAPNVFTLLPLYKRSKGRL